MDGFNTFAMTGNGRVFLNDINRIARSLEVLSGVKDKKPASVTSAKKVRDILPYISEYASVYIYDDDELIAYYDGKNSISPEINELIVIEGGIRAKDNNLNIQVIR